MDNKEIIDNLIEKYISGTLTEEETLELDSYIKTKPLIKQEMKIKKDLSKAMNYLGNQELKSTLERIHNEEISKEESQTKTFNLKRILSIAAVFICGIVLFQVVSNNLHDVDSGELFSSYYKPYHASFQTRSEIKMVAQEYKEAYTNGDYDKALSIISPKSIDFDNEILLTAGVSAVEIGDSELGRKYFENIIESGDFYFKDHAMWYTGLSFLKDGSIDKAKKYIQALADDPEADHHHEAIEILDKIK